MPDDVDAVITDVFRDPAGRERPGTLRSMYRLDGGVVALDYGDDGHVFQMTVELVPRRRWTPDRPLRIGRVDGVDVDFVGVTVDNFVHVKLTAPHTDERERLTRSYTDAFELWAAAASEGQAEPPEQPAHRLMRIGVTVKDNLETVYVFGAGQAGGTGTEWDATQSFRPRPASGVSELRLTLQAPEQPAVSVTVAL